MQGKHPHRNALLRKALLLLLAQNHQPTLPDEASEDVHVPSHTAVRQVEDTALPCYIVLQDDNTIFFQAISAAGKKCKEVLISQVSCKWGQIGRKRQDETWAGGRCVGIKAKLRVKRLSPVHTHTNYLIA